MPQRTNAFQQLVRRIYAQLTEGAVLTESAVVQAPDGTRREIDILIEYRLADVPMRVAIECRDHRRTSDIQWMDSLVGKYQDLPIDRIIAVSKSGFSKSAQRKAKAHRIELRSLRSALSADWQGELQRVMPISITTGFQVLSVVLNCTPPLPADIGPETGILVGGTPSTIDELVRHLFLCLRKKVIPQQLHCYGELAAMPEVLENTYELTVGDTVIVLNGTHHRLESCEISARTSVRAEPVEPQEELILGNVAVTIASHYVPELNEHATVTVTQTPGEAFVRLSEEVTQPPVAKPKQRTKKQ